MSESRRKYTPKLFMLTDAQIAFIASEAELRDPAIFGKRGASQNQVARDVVDFARANPILFASFVATCNHVATSGTE